MAYTLEFASKATGRDFAVCKLEGLFDPRGTRPAAPGSSSWTMMIRVPSFLAANDLDAARTEAFAAEQGLAPHGRHHEIYLSDPRRVPPERLRTILRQPVEPARPPEG